MVRRDGYAKVLDFGLARLQPAVMSRIWLLSGGVFETVAAAGAGTPGYMSPEQINGAAVDARSDIFACGILLCELTTGTNPFVKPTALETLHALAQTPAPVADVTAQLAPDVTEI